MSLQLGETFSGCKIQRPVQWVLRTKNSLLFKHNEKPKISLPPPPLPPVSKGLLRPCKSEKYDPLFSFIPIQWYDRSLFQSYDSYQLVKVMESRKVTFGTAD